MSDSREVFEKAWGKPERRGEGYKLDSANNAWAGWELATDQLRLIFTTAIKQSTSTLDGGPENDGWIAVIQHLRPFFAQPGERGAENLTGAHETGAAHTDQPDDCRAVFEKWGNEQWEGRNIPHNAWLGYQAAWNRRTETIQDWEHAYKLLEAKLIARESSEPTIKAVYRPVTEAEQVAIAQHWIDVRKRIAEHLTVIKIHPAPKPYCMDCGSKNIGYKTEIEDGQP